MAQILVVLFAIVFAVRPQSPADTTVLRAAGPASEPTAILDTSELMDIFLKPAYAELQQAMAKPPAENLLFFRNHEDVRKPERVATTARARQAAADVAAAALLGLRTVRADNYDAVRTTYDRVADTCNARHRTFARDAVTVKP
jgi:predicted ATPase